MSCRIRLIVAGLTLAAAAAQAQPRVWIADQGFGTGGSNTILEIDPYAHDPEGPDGSDVLVLNELPSPAGAFLDELTFDDQERLWCVVKEEPDQDPDGARRIDKETGAIDVPPGMITPTFPGEVAGGFLEGLAWDGVGLWVSAVRDGFTGNMLTRVDPLTGDQIAPFDSGPLGATGLVNIDGTIAQGLLWEPGNGGYGWLWHSDWGISRIYKLDLSLLFDGDDNNDNDLTVAEFSVPFKPKGMDWMEDKIWVASPENDAPDDNGIWEFDPQTGGTQQLFTTPNWTLDGLAILAEPPGPRIDLSTDTIERLVWIFNVADNDTFTVTNGRTGQLDYNVTDDADWLSVVPAGGSSTGEADLIDVSYDVDTFPAGVYTATITVTGNAYNSPQHIAVTVTVETVGPDIDGDCDVDQEDFGLFQACLTGSGNPITDPDCLPADFDGEGDADADDFGRFQGCHTGATLCADPNCEDDVP